MIFDNFKNIPEYYGIPYLKEIQRFAAGRDCSRLPDGEVEILGRDLFVRIAEYSTGPASEKRFEAHQVYADLQWVVLGREIMEVSLAPERKAVTAYDPAADIQFFAPVEETGSLLVATGQMTIFLPGELHKPGCEIGNAPGRVKKLVFKIRI